MANEAGDTLKGILARMSTVIGHEIRNPLAVISNSNHFIKAKLATAGGDLDPKIAKHLGYIAAEIGRANGMIDDLVLLGRTPKLETSLRDLNALLGELLDAQTMPPGVTLEREFSKGAINLPIDVKQFDKAVLKIFANAVEASASGGKIVLKTETAGKAARLIVSDEGPGFPSEILTHLFEPFWTTKPRGLGLGLRLAHDIVQAHGGTLTARNGASKSAVVTIELPLT